MIDFYQFQSPLSQTGDARKADYIASLGAALNEELRRVELEKYMADEFALLYVASGGSEGYFLQVFERLKKRHCFILTSGESNSLAASMEILSFLQKHGGRGEILHGDVAQVAARIGALAAASRAKKALRGKTLGCIGEPSDWLIASNYAPEEVKAKTGLGFVPIEMRELLDEIGQNRYEDNEFTRLFKAQKFDAAETEKALCIYGALKGLVERYGLLGVSLRCFDLLDSVHSTGCLALSILNSMGVYGGCEGDLPSLLSMAIMGSVTGEPVFMCNPSRFDTTNGRATFAHCTVPTTMLKDFCLNTHFESGIGAAVQGRFDEGDCTLFKCEGDLSRFYAEEGQIERTPFSEMLCRTQVNVKLKDFDYFLTRPINNHHILCRGKHKAALEAFFGLLEEEKGEN